MYFVGSPGSGKSTLVSRFLYPSKVRQHPVNICQIPSQSQPRLGSFLHNLQVEPAKPSPGLEYTFARKAAAYDPNRWDCPARLAATAAAPARMPAQSQAASCACNTSLRACRKDIAHIWELAGGEALSAQLTQGSHTFLTHRQVGMLHVFSWVRCRTD